MLEAAVFRMMNNCKHGASEIPDRASMCHRCGFFANPDTIERTTKRWNRDQAIGTLLVTIGMFAATSAFGIM
jgi:hypothetical protein